MSIFKPGTLDVPKPAEDPKPVPPQPVPVPSPVVVPFPARVPLVAAEYEALYSQCKVVESLGAQLKGIADRALANRAKYDEASYATGLPWFLIAGLHYRESSMNFNCHMANGDPLFDSHGNGLKTIHVPAGKGPYKDWAESAIASLGDHKGGSWGIGDCLKYAEAFNGLGYRKRGIFSPYIWSGTNRYSAGKYVADGVFSSTTIDKQMGVAGIMKLLGV